jgi:phosphoenolpyruvate-protein kinase (PTS system EI component)
VSQQDHGRQREIAHAALAGAAEGLRNLAAGLPPDEAAILDAGALMAEDPALLVAVDEAIDSDGLSAPEAILRATANHAGMIAAVGDETLAARADDVRSVGRRAVRLISGGDPEPPAGVDVILIAQDLGPADVAELGLSLAAIALVGGGATAHAAIVARSLGIPMVTGLPGVLLEVGDGTLVSLDGTAGTLCIEPSQANARAARDQMRARRLAVEVARAARDRPAVTTDGRRVAVLANVASPIELEAGLASGAEGIGLLRTELAFLDAAGWPSEAEHRDALEPILRGLAGRPAVVRVLDFGADKSPPFLHGVPERGLALLLANSDGLMAQLRAIIGCGRGRELRILLPMVDDCEQVIAFRAAAARAAAAVGSDALPPIGSMIETPSAARGAAEIARHSDFLSIGTNDLTATTLGADRFAADGARAHDPKVLRAIAASVEAAHDAGIAIEVCGEAASDPVMLPLLVGLGVDEVSVGAARVGEVRGWIRRLSSERVQALARCAVGLESADAVERAIRAATDSDEAQLLSA